jgi:hypothetical protein
MHSEKSAISLSLRLLLLLYQPRLARNQSSRLELGPTHASLRSRTAIMITTSNSSVKRSGTPNQLLGVQLHTIAISELSRVRTELFHLLVIPTPAHHPVQSNRQSASHGDLGNFPPSSHRQVEALAAPLGQAAYCDLRRFHQQEAQHRAPLFGNMPQPSPIPAGLFQRHQPQIARHLLAAAEPLRLADDQHES